MRAASAGKEGPGAAPVSGGALWFRRAVAVVRRREAWAIAFMAGLLTVFFLLLLAIRGGDDELLGADHTITRSLQTFRSGTWDALGRLTTHVGDFQLMSALAVLPALALLRGRRRWAALLLGLSLLGHPLNLGLKLLAQRPRPSAEVDMVDVVMRASGTSFPSGHAMAALMFYGFLAFLVWVVLPNRRRRVFAVVALGAVPFVVGVSRVYVGGHWFSDVVGGWAVGLFFLIGLAELYRIVGAKEAASAATEAEAKAGAVP